MSEAISFCVPGQPMAWKRPGGNGKMRFERKEVTSQKALFVFKAQEKMGDREPLMVPIHLFVQATFAIPESWPKWKQDAALAGHIEHTRKPDSDNLLKLVKDALNAVVWRDDSYISSCAVEKTFGPVPGVQVEITPLPKLPSQIERKSAYLEFLKGDTLFSGAAA